MTDGPDTAGQDPAVDTQAASWVPQPPTADGPSAHTSAGPAERPELALGAAFAGGLLAALILKRLAR